MKTGAAFLAMLGLAAAGAVAVLRLAPPVPVAPPPAPAAAAAPTILAGHPVTFALTHALAQGTALTVGPAWPPGLPWSEQAEFARVPTAAWSDAIRTATAVVTLRHAARGDPLFAAVRGRVPRVVELDASVAADQITPVVRLRADVAAGPAFALGPTNALSLADRIASDLSALFPPDAAALAENLRATKERLLRLKAKFDVAYARLAVPEAAVAGDAFDYLCEDFGVQVVVRLAPDAAGWSAVERERQIAQLQRAAVGVSVHAAPPGPELAAALRQAGVMPVVLDPLTRSVSDPEAYFRALEENLAALEAALGRER